MANYFTSLAISSVSNDQSSPNHPTTITGTYSSTLGSAAPDSPYNLFIEEVNPSGKVLSIDNNVTVNSVGNGQYSITYNAYDFPIPQGYRLEVATTDTSNGSTISSTGFTATSNIDGYLAGSTVYVDANNNGVLDPGEYSTTSNYQGTAFLPGGAGQIISTGGTDTLTGLGFTGTMSAVAGATVVTPLTTLVNLVSQSNGGNVAAAQAAVAASLGLTSGVDLDSLDPIAATQAGSAGAAAALAQSAAVIDTAKLITAAGATGNPLAAIAAQIAGGGGAVDLTNAATVATIAAASGLGSSSSSAIGQIAAASNAALVQAASTGTTDAASIINAVAAVSRVAQGTTASQVAAAGGDASRLAQVVAANTGTSLQDLITRSDPSGIVTGASTNNSITDSSSALQSFLSMANSDYTGSAIGYIDGTPGTTVGFGGQIGIVAPGAQIGVTLAQSADLFVTGGAKVDLSGTPRFDANGNRIAANVLLGSGANTLHLNHGPSAASSSTGNDTILSGGGFDTLTGGFGSDSLRGGGHSTLSGGSLGGDTLHGGLYGFSHDTIFAGVGGDLIVTNRGSNLIYGNENDTIRAGSAQDTIVAGYGSETIHGGYHSSIIGGGQSIMDRGIDNNYSATGSDTIYGSGYNNTVDIRSDATAVTVDGRSGSGHLTVNVASGGQGNDTLFGGTSADGTGSNLDVNVTQAFTVQKDLDQNGLHVVQLQGGQTLHVNNVTLDFNGTKTHV